MPDVLLAHDVTTVREHCAHELYGRWDFATELTAAEQAETYRFMNAGLMLWYTPPVLPGEFKPHIWSFSEDSATFDFWPSVAESVLATGVYDGSTYTLITAQSASFYPSMLGKTITIASGGGSYPIAVYVSPTQVKIAGNYGWASTKKFSIACDGNYPMPETFAAIEASGFVYPAGIGIDRIRPVAVNAINTARGRYSSFGPPTHFAIRFAHHTYLAQQGKEVMVWPTPATYHQLQYRFRIHPYKIDGSHLWFPGGPEFGKSFLAACLAAIESYKLRSMAGPRWQEFIIQLSADVQMDRATNPPPTLGPWSVEEYEVVDSLVVSQTGNLIYTNP